MISSLLAAGIIAASATPAIGANTNNNFQQAYVDGGDFRFRFKVKPYYYIPVKQSKHNYTVYAVIWDKLNTELTYQLPTTIGTVGIAGLTFDVFTKSGTDFSNNTADEIFANKTKTDVLLVKNIDFYILWMGSYYHCDNDYDTTATLAKW